MRSKIFGVKLTAVVAMLGLTTGCAQFWPIGPDVTKNSSEVEAKSRVADSRLHEVLALVASGDLAAQKAKIDSLQKSPDLNSQPHLQMQMAILLRLGHPQVRDEKKAAELVRWAVQTGDVPRDKMAAGLIMSLFSELESRNLQLEKANASNRDLTTANRDLTTSVRQLEDKLKAIKSIEQSIIQRGQ